MNTNPLMTARSVRLIPDRELTAMWRGRNASLSPRAKLLICDELTRRKLTITPKRKRR